MQDVDRMHRLQRLREPEGDPDQIVATDRTGLVHLLVQGEPGDVPRDDVRRLTPGIGVEDLRDTSTAHAPQRGDLARQPGAGLVVADDVRAQLLERDMRSAVALGQVYDAHAALADPTQQPVGPHVRRRGHQPLGHAARVGRG